MKRRIGIVIAAVGMAMAGTACAVAASVLSLGDAAAPAALAARAATDAASASTWGKAEQVPGLAPLVAPGGNSAITTMSCSSPGNCSAGGFYQITASGHQALVNQAFVVSQVKGIWQHAMTVPGIAALDSNQGAQVSSISCSSAGNCSAGGSYTSGYYAVGGGAMSEAFVVSQVSGVWGTAQEVPGIGALNAGGQAYVSTVSCTGPGGCTAVGGYADTSSSGSGCCRYAGFAVSEVGSAWGSAQKVAAASLGPLSCSTPGNCSALAGDVAVSQVDGTWGAPHAIAAAAGSTFGKPSPDVISCASPGNCSAGGIGQKQARAIVASQVNGTWGSAHEVRGIPVLLKRKSALVATMSCTAPRSCVAGGYAFKSEPEGSSTRQYAAPYVVSERKGTWGDARQIPGLGKLSKYGYATINVIACTSPGNCTAAGSYSASSYNPNGSGPDQVFVASESGGVWGMAREIISVPANVGQAGIASLACPTAGKCSAGGAYWPNVDQQVAFVVSQVR